MKIKQTVIPSIFSLLVALGLSFPASAEIRDIQVQSTSTSTSASQACQNAQDTAQSQAEGRCSSSGGTSLGGSSSTSSSQEPGNSNSWECTCTYTEQCDSAPNSTYESFSFDTVDGFPGCTKPGVVCSMDSQCCDGGCGSPINDIRVCD